MSTRTSVTSKVRLEPSFEGILFTLVLYVWAIFVWACPSLIGIWTQIRKGLPEFAKAPRTIIAASNYEAHRLTYLAIVMLAGMACDAGVRITLFSGGWSWARHQTGERCFEHGRVPCSGEGVGSYLARDAGDRLLVPRGGVKVQWGASGQALLRNRVIWRYIRRPWGQPRIV